MEKSNHRNSINKIKIYGLGRFLIRYGNIEKNVDDWTSDKALRMFKYFLLNRHKEIYNEELVEVFWPNIDPDTGKKRLYNTIYLLRKNLGIKDIVINKTTSYKFNENYSCWIDWERFLDIYDSLNDNVTVDELKEAIELYKGDLMPGLRYEYWVEEIRTNIKEKYLDLIYQLSEKLYKNNEYLEALKYLKKGINEELYREEYYNLAMKILVQTGRVYEALTVYEKYKKLIKDDLGIDPGSTINQTYHDIKNCEIIKKHVRDDIKTKGALICNIDVFNKIYELENRQISRTDKHFTLLEMDFSEVDLGENSVEDICNEMAVLFRSGDVICCYNNVINILLHDMDIEKTNFVLNRIFKFLKEKNIHKKPKFDFKEISD